MVRGKELYLEISSKDEGIGRAAMRLAEYILDIPCTDRRWSLIVHCLKSGVVYLKKCIKSGNAYSLEGFAEACTMPVDDVLRWQIFHDNNEVWDAFKEPLTTFIERSEGGPNSVRLANSDDAGGTTTGLAQIVRLYMIR